ncbi:thyroid adenoma-associated protein homolog [Zerene cesonia]|uniref:thyroid adenoma-associated protein homolog n=1 Tax=Zerene cesonia TaxID=33412 RepID=UPI0018E5472B|nr:thyroid adenoma-associated protein homolog [Zerene cesonia]
MNGLSLRISGGGSKIKNPLGFEPVSVPQDVIKNIDANELHENFFNSQSVDNQLSILKTIVNNNVDAYDVQTIKFFVIVYLHAEAKHPVKSFLSRCVTKNKSIEDPFSKALSLEIESMVKENPTDHKSYIDTVSKIATCVENFPAGAIAIKNVELFLAVYLFNCLSCCVETLRSNNLSPTEKNELFNLVHLTLRLLLYLVQKVHHNKEAMIKLFPNIRSSVKEILFDDEAPMDTKSVCGLLLVGMHLLENDEDSWVDLLSESVSNLQDMLSNDSAKLSLYSAIVTVVPVNQLHTKTVGNEVAVCVLLDNIMAVGERMSAHSTFTLSVTRSLVQISKSLDKAKDLGLTLIDRLLVFVWSHLEHYMDSVRHLTAQMLNNIVKYSAALKKQGDDTAVNNIFTALNTLDRHQKSFYLTLTALTNELGASYVMEVFPDIVDDVMCMLDVQAVQASARTCLSALARAGRGGAGGAAGAGAHAWVRAALRHAARSPAVRALEELLALALADARGLDFVLPYIKQSTQNASDLKCVLLLLSVVRKSRGLDQPDTDEMWKGVLSYDVLENAAVDATDETRILSLSLIVESPKTTEVFTERELDFVLHFLKYNCNAQAPHFRQLMLSLLKKFVKRLEDSYKALKRTSNIDYYPQFVEKLREQCFSNLLRGANYSRRLVALQTLSWIDGLALDGYQRIWKDLYVERLLAHLEDSYENNKILALDVLDKCPKDMFQREYATSLKMADILAEASSVKPTDCTSAAYKLLLLKQRCPEYVIALEPCKKEQPERVSYILMGRLVSQLDVQLATCGRSVVRAARDAPMYGLLHCLRYLVQGLDAGAISSDGDWTELIRRIISVCLSVNSAVSGVVNNSSPEGHLPMDMGNVVTDHNMANACLQDGRPVTAQMVLLCAWRSVKEVSLLLGALTSRLAIEGEGGAGGAGGVTLGAARVRAVGAHFAALLAETKHRGAFEQAYVGFTMFLTRLWRCRSPELHELPKRWLEELLEVIEAGHNDKLCATRRSAGLPYMIQALVITELKVTGSSKGLTRCMRQLLRLAASGTEDYRGSAVGSGTEDNSGNTFGSGTGDNSGISVGSGTEDKSGSRAETRAHCSNILRALYRDAALDDAVAPFVADGLVLAVSGFDADTWLERNAATLLFSALCGRAFGAARPRTRMTGRIFFLRYPKMADFMLNKLNEANQSGVLVRQSVYPVLLLLARLYPSALEGTVSNIKLSTFVPRVVRCGASALLRVRELAARAAVPLVPPLLYISHLESMLKILGDRNIKRNYCHGITLQILKQLEAKPDIHTDEQTQRNLSRLVLESSWVVRQTLSEVPCYLITDDYVKMLDLFICRFPSPLNTEFIKEIKPLLHDILFEKPTSIVRSGREMCLSSVVKLYTRILNIHNDVPETCVFVQKCLKHDAYEVTLVIMNYLLSVHEESGGEYEKMPILENCLPHLRRDYDYVELLCDILENGRYLECKQTALKLLNFEDSQAKIVQANFDYLRQEHNEKMTHVYLKSLTNFVSKKLRDNCLESDTILEEIRTIYGCVFSDKNEETRGVVVEFLEGCFDSLFTLNVGLKGKDLFEYRATVWAMLVILLEDDEQTYRQRISNVITNSALLDTSDRQTDNTTDYRFDKTFDTERKCTDDEMSIVTGRRSPGTSSCTDYKLDTSFDTDNKCGTSYEGRVEVIPSRAVEYLMKLIGKSDDGVKILCVLALLDFKSEVSMYDEVDDEWRVFDTNERYNIFSEEIVLTATCARALQQYCDKPNCDYINQIIIDPVYVDTFENLCDQNLVAFKSLISKNNNSTVINPKVTLLFEEILCN